jgi:hypothetical protein
MQTLRALLLLTLCASAVCATGCATQTKPWDPPEGRALFEQLPNWQGKAARQCGGHLRPEQRKPGMTDRC